MGVLLFEVGKENKYVQICTYMEINQGELPFDNSYRIIFRRIYYMSYNMICLLFYIPDLLWAVCLQLILLEWQKNEPLPT